MYNGINDILGLLGARRLKEALTQLQGICAEVKDWQLRNRIEEVQTSYGYMLQYAGRGMDDPERRDFYRRTLRTAYELTEWADIALEAEKGSGAFYDKLRTLAIRPPHTFAELRMQLEAYTEDMGTAPLLYHDAARLEAETTGILQRREEAVDELFDKVWTSLLWSEADYAGAVEILRSVLVAPADLAVMVSAVTMSLLRLFDARKLAFLLEAYRHEDLTVNRRALVGILLCIYRKAERIALYPDLLSRLSLLMDDDGVRRDICTVQMQLLQTRETQKIDKRMREEIIPEVMKQSKLMRKFKFDESEDPEERNPEWEEWIDKSGVTDKIREMGEWQMAGADIYMGSFAQLKHYPFFRQTAHWFYPFDLNRPSLAQLKKDFGRTPLSPLQLVVHSDFFCSSDKYSFCFALQQMPQGMKENAMGELDKHAQMSDEQRQMLEDKINAPKKAADVSRLYIQDLYRFFKLNPGRKREEDLFTLPFDFWRNDLLRPVLSSDLKEIADYLFQKEYPDEAFLLYKELTKEGHDTAEIWQKTGFILQKQRRYADAIEEYRHADLLAPDNLWTLKHLAQCHRNHKDYDLALEYYRKVEAVEPDNLNIALQIGQCLTKLEKYGEALASFYKVEYLEKNPDNARRAIAWCSFLTRRYDEATKYYVLLLDSPSPKAEDRMNAGHVCLVTGDVQSALEHYRKAHEQVKSHSDFIALFNEDKEVLLAQGLAEEDLDVMLDLLV